MKIYIIQEDYTCDVETTFGEMGEAQRNDVVAIASSREDAIKALANCIYRNSEEYCKVDTNDYNVYEVDAESGKILYEDKGEIHDVWLSDEETEQVEKLVKELEEKKGKILW